MNSLSKRTRKNFFAVSNLKLIFMTKNNLPTNLKETNSNRSNRRSLIGHHRMANLLRLISLLKNAAWTSKNSISTKASNFQIFLKKNGLPTKILKLGTTLSSNQPTKAVPWSFSAPTFTNKKLLDNLADTKFYAKVNKDLTQANQKIVKDTVNKLILEQKLPSTARNLFVTTPKTSTFYLKPKIHKPNNPGRPIISACSCPTELISSFLDKKIAPFVKSLPTYIKDTNHALNILKQFSFPGNNKFLFTMDITSLYTVIPNNEGLLALKYFSTNAPSKNPLPTHCFVWLNLS